MVCLEILTHHWASCWTSEHIAIHTVPERHISKLALIILKLQRQGILKAYNFKLQLGDDQVSLNGQINAYIGARSYEFVMNAYLL